MSNGCNRCDDKTVQFLIGKNGFVGVNYEHTPAEGPPIATMTDFICDRILASDFKIDTTTSEEQVRRLDFELNDSQKAQIKNSERQLDWVADDLDVAVYTFKRYGKNFPKSVKLSPDSFIQMAFQLAFYRIHSTCPTRNLIQLCFGPAAPDCYGICYNPQETELHFTVTSFKKLWFH
ncbi:hypothetical protein KIN20_029372 [Parelaphostrongylus tenuis]|uniref:Choline/carnitine acyltransferase domain-containing protein n=1 Tax=Parelaphostrongylus tenuis TaxID=148309 RepID=A0AAD5R2I4_PARTN|nr:hypothetical protein KIN20_029372 [Parelaphostrongylus tenuis]